MKTQHKLLPTLDSVRPLAESYPHNYQYAALLTAYAANPDAATEQILRQALSSANKTVQKAAAEALSSMSGVKNARDKVFSIESTTGFKNMTVAQKHYFAVSTYDGEVNNGGHAQYFVNSSGKHWQMAIDGLNAIGALDRAAILLSATAVFGSNGPSEDDERRHEQIAKLRNAQLKNFRELDSSYFACKQSVGTLFDNKLTASPRAMASTVWCCCDARGNRWTRCRP
jgi:HEAT repeat protein